MKILKTILLISIMHINLNLVFGQMIVVGNVSMGFINMPTDIIIQSGGTLNLTGPVHMGGPNLPPVRITIEDGGKLYSNGGSLLSYAPGTFEGIYVKPTPYIGGNTGNALELTNFTIDGMQWGIIIEGNGGPSLSSLNINQRIQLSQITFSNCNASIVTSISGSTNYIDSYNPIICDQCDFLASSPSVQWPVHIVNAKNVTFTNCNFNTSGPAKINLHMRDINDLTVENCTFNGQANAVGMLFHGFYDNASVLNNSFYTPESGISITAGYVTNSVFANNLFYGGIVGLTIGDASVSLNHFTSNTDGAVNNVEILNNTFENNAIGLQSGVINSSATQLPENITVIGNTFKNCVRGTLFNGQNSNITINCNDFYDSQLAGIEINDPFLNNFVLQGLDPYNRFFNSAGVDIRNINSTSTFGYEHLTGTNYPGQPTSTSNVNLIPVNLHITCE